MLLHHLLELEEDENIFLAEESMEDLITLPVTRDILAEGLDADSSIDIPGLGIAYHLNEPAEFWLLLTDRYSNEKILEGRKTLKQSCKKVRVQERDYLQAIIEYYATSLADELLCERCSIEGPSLYVDERIDRLESFLKPLVSKNMSILEVCCGSGMATQALLRLGHDPLSMDSDRCDLCQSLKGGLMNPQRSFVLDAMLLPRFFPKESFDAVMGFMIGLIDKTNWQAWREIILASSSLAKNMVLYTVYTSREAELIAQVMGDAGWNGKIIDNRDPKGIYDQWAYQGLK